MAKKELEDAIKELETWLPSQTTEFAEFVMGLLASLPGGEDLQDIYEPVAPMGWKEMMLIADLLSAIETQADVEEVIERLAPDEPEEED